MPTSHNRPRSERFLSSDESGAFLILYALLFFGLLAMVAIVIDLSQLRSVRRTSQSVADFAALAGANELSDTSGGDPVTACQDAFKYVKKNTPEFPASATIPCTDLTADPDTLGPRVPCNDDSALGPLTPPLVLEAAGDAPYTLTITYPVSDAMIDDSRRGGSGVLDGKACERMRVSLRKTDDSYFSGILGINSLENGASSTARGFITSEGNEMPALVILEKESCGALTATGQGGIVAKGSGKNPGIIAVASAGSTSRGGCNNTTTAQGKIVLGSALPSGHPTRAGLPSIEAFEAEIIDPATGAKAPPVLRVYAMNTPNSARSAYEVPTGVNPGPVEGPRIHRGPIDARYGAAIADLRIDAASPPGAYVTLSSIRPSCTVDASNRIITNANVRIDCDLKFQGGPTGTDEVIFTGSNFVFTRNLDVASGKKWVFSAPQLLVVNRNQTNKAAVTSQGTLWINTGVTTAGATLPENFCEPNRNGSAFPTTRFVVRDGWLDTNTSGADLKMCQTTVYMADGAASPRPDNDNNSYEGHLSVGGGKTDWTAPDQSDLPVCSPPLLVSGCYDKTDAQYELEDLALWTETAPLSNIGGAGSVFLTGVFFLPNATFSFTGQALQNIDRNAQFVSRKLDMAGQGTLVLRPDPNDAVPFLSGASLLIR